jgi:HlyD family secretion protein
LLLAGCSGESRVNPSGTFEATEVDLSSLLSGQVLRVGPRLGDRVETGDTLLVIDTEIIRLQRDQAVAGLSGVESRRLAARDQLVQARRSLALAELTLARIQAMHADGNASQQSLDEAATQRDLAASQLSAAEHAVAALDAEERAYATKIAVAERQLKDGVLLSPITGTVLLRAIEPGEMAQAGSTSLRLADLSRLELRFYLEVQQLSLVKIGQQLPLKVDALPHQEYNGTVTWISDEAEFTPKNAQTRTARAQLVYAVKLAVDNPDGRLHIGMPAEVVF